MYIIFVIIYSFNTQVNTLNIWWSEICRKLCRIKLSKFALCLSYCNNWKM